MLFRCAVEPFWEEVAAEVRKNYKPVDAVGPRSKKKKAKRPRTGAAAPSATRPYRRLDHVAGPAPFDEREEQAPQPADMIRLSSSA